MAWPGENPEYVEIGDERMTKKTLSVLLALLLVLSLFPTAALAEEESEDALPQLEDQLPEAGPEDPDEDASQDVEDILPEGRPSDGSDTEPSYPSEPEPEPEADPAPEEETVTAEFITSGPDIVSGGNRPARVAARVADVNEPAEDFFGGQLETAAYTVYNLLYENYFNSDGTVNTNAPNTDIDVSSADATVSDVVDAAVAFDRDYPEVFWLGDLKPSYNASTGIVSTVSFDVQAPWANAGKLADDSAALNDAVAALADTAINAAGSDVYAALKYIHDTLVNNNAYNTGAAGGDHTTQGEAPWEAISALDSDRSPVCEGYARAFKLVCDYVGIPCILVSGLSEAGNNNSAHMWNYVQLENFSGNPTWYLVDATFDDPTTTSGADAGALLYDYFLIGTKDLTALKDTRVRNSHFMQVNGSYNSDFGYPTLNNQSFWADAGVTGAAIIADPEATKEVELQGGGTLTVYEVPASTGLDIGLTAAFQVELSEDEGGSIGPQMMPIPNMATWETASNAGEIGVTLTPAPEDTNNSNFATFSIAPGKAGDSIHSVPVRMTYTQALSANLTIFFMYVEKPAPTVTVALDKDAVEIPAPGDTAATINVTATEAEEGGAETGATIRSVKVTNSAGQAVSTINAVPAGDGASATVSVGAGTSVGVYTVTVTTSNGGTGTATFTTKKAASVATTFSGTVNGKKLSESTPVTLAIPLASSTPYPISFTVKDQYGTAMAAPTYKLETAVNGVTVSGSTMTVTSAAEAGTATLVVTSGSVSRKYPIKLAKIEFSGLDNVTATGTYGETWRTILGGISFSGAQATLDGAKQDGTFKAALPVNTNDTDTPIANTYSLDITFDGVSTGKTATVTVAPKPITVTIANASRYYGQENPEFKGTVNTSQLVGSDTETDLPSYTLSAKTEADAAVSETTLPGTYKIVGPSTATANNQYTLTFVEGTLTVKPAQMKLSLTTDNNTVSKATLEANKTNFTALGLPDDINVVFTEDDKSTELTIDSAPPALNVTWAVTGSTSIDQALAALDGENAPDSVDLTLTPTVTSKPDWATLPTTLPTFTLTVTGREVATITVENWGTDYAARIYDGTAQEAPEFKVTGKDSAELGIEDNTKFSYRFETTGANPAALEAAPKAAGTYKLVATYRDDTYYGRFSQEFTISPKKLSGLTWAGTDTRDYNGTASSVTATVTTANGLIDGDTVTVTVSGGDATNAGTHTATATGLTGADAGNYTLPDNKTTTYTIDKIDWPLTVPASVLLCPKTGLSKTLDITCNGAASSDTANITLSLADPTVRASADAVRLDSAARTVTAIGNGTANVTVTAAASTNYNAVTKTIPVTAYAQPVKGITAVTSTDGTAKLAAALDGNAIMVSGFWADGSAVTGVEPDLFGSLTSSYADGTLTVKDGDTVVAEYTVNTKAVVILPSGVKLEEGDTTGTVSETIPEASKTEVEDAVRSDENKLEGAVESAASTLVDIAKAETAKPGNDGKTVTVQVDLKIEAKAVVTAPTAPTDAKKASYTIDVQPVCKVYVTDQPGDELNDAALRNSQPLSSGFTTPVTVTVELPAFLASALDTDGVNLFAKHTRSDGTVEYLETTVKTEGGAKTATWQMSSFSDVELYAIANKTITVNYKDSSGNVTQTVTYGETDRGGKLLDNKTWTISGQQYTTVAQLLDSDLTGTVDAAPAPVTPVDPPSRPSGGGGGGGGGSSFGSYSISAPTSSSKHGSVSLSTTSARKGDTVTITPKPDAGYVLDTLVVRDSSGKQIEVKAAGDGKYTFVMPAGQVTVEATFRQEGESGSWPFADVDRDSFWAAGAIAWVYEQGYMNGNSASTFNPGGTITRQQMWMILARLSGQNPASFAEARQWAMDSGVSDGTNGPNAMSRQQMVTFLYRYAQLKGYALTGASDIDAFPDSGLAANYAQEPLAWAVGNGIVTGTSDGALNPTGTATRAHFAVILQRFCENTAKD